MRHDSPPPDAIAAFKYHRGIITIIVIIIIIIIIIIIVSFIHKKTGLTDSYLQFFF